MKGLGPNATGGRVLVTGAAGMLGSQLLLDAPEGFEAVGTDLVPASSDSGGPEVSLTGFDLTDSEEVQRLFRDHGPFVGLIHPAAYTAVDAAEENEALAFRVNAEAPRILAAACREAGIPMVMISTDFVFDGRGSRPYREDDPTDALGVYGRSKLAGEVQAMGEHAEGVRVVRTQWLYGPRGKHFPRTMRWLARERDQFQVVSDQIGSPTSTLELAPAVWDVLTRGEAGIYHAACEGECSWYDLALAAIEPLRESEDVQVEVVPCTTEEYPVPAPRPAYSTLSCGRLTELRGGPLPDWRVALNSYLAADETV